MSCGFRKPLNSPSAFSEPRRGIRRKKVFAMAGRAPLDRNTKVRVRARAPMRRTEPREGPTARSRRRRLPCCRRCCGASTTLAQANASLATRRSPSAPACARSTVAEAIRALERAGVLTWVNRIKQVREYMSGLFGKTSAWRWAVQRSSNSYSFNDPASSKSDFQTRTPAQQLSERKIASAVPPAPTVTSRAETSTPSSVELTRPISTFLR